MFEVNFKYVKIRYFIIYLRTKLKSLYSEIFKLSLYTLTENVEA
jgi:hypothetical protein